MSIFDSVDNVQNVRRLLKKLDNISKVNDQQNVFVGKKCNRERERERESSRVNHMLKRKVDSFCGKRVMNKTCHIIIFFIFLVYFSMNLFQLITFSIYLDFYRHFKSYFTFLIFSIQSIFLN